MIGCVKRILRNERKFIMLLKLNRRRFHLEEVVKLLHIAQLLSNYILEGKNLVKLIGRVCELCVRNVDCE